MRTTRKMRGGSIYPSKPKSSYPVSYDSLGRKTGILRTSRPMSRKPMVNNSLIDNSNSELNIPVNPILLNGLSQLASNFERLSSDIFMTVNNIRNSTIRLPSRSRMATVGMPLGTGLVSGTRRLGTGLVSGTRRLGTGLVSGTKMLGTSMGLQTSTPPESQDETLGDVKVSETSGEMTPIEGTTIIENSSSATQMAGGRRRRYTRRR